MGFGEFGGNGSVHWRVVAQTPTGRGLPPVAGADPIPFKRIGAKFKKKSHAKKFKVTLRYRNSKAAASALAQVQAAQAKAKTASVELTVDAINRVKPQSNLPWEIRIDW